MQPSYDYFENKFWTDIVNAFKAVRLFNPEKITDLNSNATTVEELRAFPFLEDVIPNFIAELAQYLGLADGVAKVDLLDWWFKNEEKLPSWEAAYKKVILCQPSSAAVERVFSILKSSFDTDQNKSLEDNMWQSQVENEH